MDKPTLLVLAAGMGSRFGGLKQIEPLGPNGEIIIDYSLYDAYRAGFGKVVFVIKKELEDTFREVIGSRAEKLMKVEYAFQDTSMLPDGFTCPDGRTKPWGTGHAVWCARHVIDGPFGVINADDFYGRDAYARLGEFLSHKAAPGHMCMVGFPLENTLTENGTVSRGICMTKNGLLASVTERTAIARRGGVISYEENGESHPIPEGSIASMNVWGLDPSVFEPMGQAFGEFLKGLDEGSRMKAEFYLPAFVDSLIRSGKTEVEVLPAASRWYGVTYREDKEKVSAALAAMHEAGEYPALK